MPMICSWCSSRQAGTAARKNSASSAFHCASLSKMTPSMSKTTARISGLRDFELLVALQRRVDAVQGEKFGVRPHFLDFSCAHHDDPVGFLNRREPVRDHH